MIRGWVIDELKLERDLFNVVVNRLAWLEI